MSTETERLARKAEEHRSQVDETIDRLKDRLSVGQIVDEISGYVREGQGADMVRNLNRQVRDNPLALGLVGAGIAWLLVGQGVRDEGRHLKDRYDDWRDRDDDHVRRSYPVSDHGSYSAGPDRQSTGSLSTPAGFRAAGNGGDGSPGLGDRVKDSASGMAASASSALSDASDKASSAASSVADTVRSAGASISDAAETVSDRVSQSFHDARDSVYETRDAAYRRGAEARDQMARYGRHARRGLLDILQEEPLIFGAVAVALGAAIGAALPATRREDQLFGRMRDDLRDEAVDYGREALDKVQNVASEAYKAGSEEADRQGLKTGNDDRKTLAERASAVAAKAAGAAKDEAEKEGLS